MTIIATSLFTALFVAAPVAPASQLAIENCDVGEIYAFNHGECEIVLSNTGDRSVRVFDVVTGIAGDHVEPTETTVPAHAKAYLKFTLNAANDAGHVRHSVRFRTDEPGHEERSASAVAFVMSVLDEPRPQLDFAVVKALAEPMRRSVDLVSHDVSDFRITKIIETPAWINAAIGADGHTLEASVKPDAGWGLHVDFLKVATNAPQQSQAWIEVKADVHGEVVPNLNPYDLGLMRIGSVHEFHIPLRSRSGREFQIGKIELEGLHGTTQVDSCEKTGKSCQMLILRVADQQPGPIKGHVWIELPEYQQRLNLAVWGLLVPADLKVKTLDADAIAQQAAAAAGQSQTSKDVDLQRAVREAVGNANQAPPSGEGPLLKWSVANGLAIHGFQIFRASDEAGPFVLLNQKTIPSIAKTQDSVGYQYRDNTAESGKTYWYYIGLVYNDGRKQQLTGPQKVVAK
jgi:hypothetical protein